MSTALVEVPVLTDVHKLRSNPAGTGSVCAHCGAESEVVLVSGTAVRRFRRPGGEWLAELVCLSAPAPEPPPRVHNDPTPITFVPGGGFIVGPEDETIDGASLNDTVKMVDLSVAFSPVLVIGGEFLPQGLYVGSERELNVPVEVQLVEGGYGLLHEDLFGRPTIHAPLAPLGPDVIARMRCRYLLQRGAWTKKILTLAPREQERVAAAFAISWVPTGALGEALGIKGAKAAAARAPRPALAAPAAAPLEVPAYAIIDGEHGPACWWSRINDPGSLDVAALPAGLKLCADHWQRVRQIQGGAFRRLDTRQYVGGRYR